MDENVASTKENDYGQESYAAPFALCGVKRLVVQTSELREEREEKQRGSHNNMKRGEYSRLSFEDLRFLPLTLLFRITPLYYTG